MKIEKKEIVITEEVKLDLPDMTITLEAGDTIEVSPKSNETIAEKTTTVEEAKKEEMDMEYQKSDEYKDMDEEAQKEYDGKMKKEYDAEMKKKEESVEEKKEKEADDKEKDDKEKDVEAEPEEKDDKEPEDKEKEEKKAKKESSREHYEANKLKEDYNGWSNYETWNAELWADNEKYIYDQKVDIIKRSRNRVKPKDVETFFRTNFPNGTPDMDGAQDMNKVDWTEIADAWNDEMYESVERSFKTLEESKSNISKIDKLSDYMSTKNILESIIRTLSEEEIDSIYECICKTWDLKID